MDKSVPDVESGNGDPDKLTLEFQEAELRLLDAEATAKESANREADQRYKLRWITVFVACLLIIVMLIVLFHMSHQVFWSSFLTVPSSYATALIIAPIASITAITIALFVASFRGFKNGDEKTTASIASESARGTGLIN